MERSERCAAVQVALMLLLYAAVMLCTGCGSLTPAQKRWTAVGISVVATGALISYDSKRSPDGMPHPDKGLQTIAGETR